MTALCVVRFDNAVFLAADRLCQFDVAKDDEPDDFLQTKIETTRNRIHLAIAGVFVGGAGDDRIDLLQLARNAVRTTKDPAEAAGKVRRAFDEIAERVRAHVSVGTFEAPEGSEQALTVVVLVGVCREMIEVHQVVLTATGPCTTRTIGDIPVAIAPAAARAVFTADVQSSLESEDPVSSLVEAMQKVASVCPDQVSAEVDVLQVFDNGSSTFFNLEAPKIVIPRH